MSILFWTVIAINFLTCYVYAAYVFVYEPFKQKYWWIIKLNGIALFFFAPLTVPVYFILTYLSNLHRNVKWHLTK